MKKLISTLTILFLFQIGYSQKLSKYAIVFRDAHINNLHDENAGGANVPTAALNGLRANTYTVAAFPDRIYYNFWIPNQNTTYYTQLNNRDFISFPFYQVDLDAITVPFRYVLPAKGKVNGIEQKLQDNFITSLNAQLFLGMTFGRVRHIYRRPDMIEKPSWVVSTGPFAGFSQLSLDVTNTITATSPYTGSTKRNAAAISYGWAIMTNIKDIRLGVFLGWDSAIGDAGRKYDFNEKPWIGFGIGYKLKFLANQGALN